jgi:hypothetical protein
MTQVTLNKLNEDIQDIKRTLHKIVHILREDFELSDEAKKELTRSRNEDVSTYVDHADVLKEFA